MSLQSAMEFVKRLREDQEFRWALGECSNKWERRRFVVTSGYRFSPAELVCATSPGGKVSEDRTATIERVRRPYGQSSYNFI